MSEQAIATSGITLGTAGIGGEALGSQSAALCPSVCTRGMTGPVVQLFLEMAVDSGPCDEFGDGLKRPVRCPLGRPGHSAHSCQHGAHLSSSPVRLGVEAGVYVLAGRLGANDRPSLLPYRYSITSNQENDF